MVESGPLCVAEEKEITNTHTQKYYPSNEIKK